MLYPVIRLPDRRASAGIAVLVVDAPAAASASTAVEFARIVAREFITGEVRGGTDPRGVSGSARVR